MFAFCLFCQTQKAAWIASELERRGIGRAFSPRIVKRQRVQGENRDMIYDLLPGYVFVYSKEDINTTRDFRGISGIIRRLGDPGDNFHLAGSDLEFAMARYKKNGLVGQITIFKEGDQVLVEDPLFRKAKGQIEKIDYKKGRARVAFEFAGTKCFSWIAFEWMEKPETEDS